MLTYVNCVNLSFSFSFTFARQQFFAEIALSCWRLGRRAGDFSFTVHQLH